MSRPITDGPFRYVRHPRYAGAMAAKIAFPLVFASALGWVLAVAWIALLFRKVLGEETHLRNLFGPEYEAYARHTARLLPGVY
jgi:protein-S-isoprenylcysteine O-methyltransferase Ste14